MAADDPTEYGFATTHLDGWTHWERLIKAGWFQPYVAAWRKELELRTRSAALKRIKAKALENGKESFQADKYLLNGQWKDQPEKRRAGTPSKQEIREAANEQITADQVLRDDLQRIKELN